MKDLCDIHDRLDALEADQISSIKTVETLTSYIGELHDYLVQLQEVVDSKQPAEGVIHSNRLDGFWGHRN